MRLSSLHADGTAICAAPHPSVFTFSQIQFRQDGNKMICCAIVVGLHSSRELRNLVVYVPKRPPSVL
jgi:hypothetical protein